MKLDSVHGSAPLLALEGAATKGAVIYSRLRLAEVLPLAGQELSAELAAVAGEARFDYVVADAEHEALFAVDYCGPAEESSQRGPDHLAKQALCERFDFPLARVRDEHLFQQARGMTYLQWLCELHVVARRPEPRGRAEPDYPPVFVSATSLARLQRLAQSGITGERSPFVLSGYDPLGGGAAVAIVPLRAGRFLFHRASIYLSGFGVTAAEAADEIAVVSLAEQASHAKEGDGLDPADLRDALVRYFAGVERIGMWGGVRFPLGFELTEATDSLGWTWAVGPLGSQPAFTKWFKW